MKKPAIFAVLLLVAFPVLAWAHVWSAYQALDEWGGVLKKSKTLHVKMEATMADGSTSQEEIWISKPNNFRRTLKNDRDQIDLLVTPTRAYKISSGKAEPIPTVDALGAIGLMYFADSYRGLSVLLRQAEVDTALTRWELREKTQLWEAGKPEGPKVSLIKNDWVPAGVVLGSKNYVFTIPLPSRYAIPFPEVVETYANNARVTLTRTVSFDTKAISPSVFDLRNLQGARK
jgi:hypothetical protein